MNELKEKIFCFDTSVFTSLNRIHNIIPIQDFWKMLEKLFKSDKIISHKYVFDEIKPGDFIGKWIQDKEQYFIGVTDKQFQNVEKILQRFPDFIDSEKEKNQADPWVIALAMEKSEENLFGKNTVVYVVSQEKISSTKKIPAVCKAFNIDHLNLEAFLKDNRMRFGIIES
ncbi:MAG: DUF4411 family protein [Nitrospinae bacterium]|nr:DUF4411 family protein [Nitrospinota bacterium]